MSRIYYSVVCHAHPSSGAEPPISLYVVHISSPLERFLRWIGLLPSCYVKVGVSGNRIAGDQRLFSLEEGQDGLWIDFEEVAAPPDPHRYGVKDWGRSRSTD